MQNDSPMIGSVFERKPSTSYSAPQTFRSGKNGFPTVQHRSKSAFSRNRDELRKKYSRSQEVPTVIESSKRFETVDPDDWRNQMSQENEQRVEGMTEEEIEEERREIIERFGSGVGDLLKRVRQARATQMEGLSTEHSATVQQPSTQIKQHAGLEEVPITSIESFNTRTSNRLSPPPPALSTSSTRPSSRADRRLRFAELSPQDVHVYESAPPSPRRKPLALPPPMGDGSAISLGQWKGTMSPQSDLQVQKPDIEPEEGSAEFIRRRYFPDAPPNDPNLAWMEPSASSLEHSATSPSLRFDLTGQVIPLSLSVSLPTHLGLHHHADGGHAGYTLNDIFLLSRSSVPAQRATMLGVLAKIAQRISRMTKDEASEMREFLGQEEELRKRILGAGVEAMSERGSVGARAVEVIWQCLVGWGEVIPDGDGIELHVPGDAAFDSLPLDFLLPQISQTFSQGDFPLETMSQLLDILYRLAQQSNNVAESIVTARDLVPNLISTFLLTPIPSTTTSPIPNASALELLIILVNSSRTNAKILQEPADALLRYITFLPPTSPYSLPLATSLLTSTLRLYTAFASYGIYSHIASTAMSHFTDVGRYVTSELCTSPKLMVAWAYLLEAWMVCAVDPHRTTPSHEILWSQIVGWGWSTEIGELADKLTEDEKDWDVWAGSWRANAAWLEGARINGIRGGSSERIEIVEAIKEGFEHGAARAVVLGILDRINQELTHIGHVPIGNAQVPHLRALAQLSGNLTSVIKLWLACLPPPSEGPLASPPFPLPFTQISELCAKITTHPMWSLVSSTNTTHLYVYCRPISALLSFYLRISRRLPDISEDLWMAQALSILPKLLPGDEEFAKLIMEELIALLTIDWATSRGIQVPTIIWDKGGMSMVEPFLTHTLRPQGDIYIGPTCMTPQSIMLATTQRLPSYTAMSAFGLPAKRDWTLSPLGDLLRSGSSAVFKTLPSSWDASETEIIRASLLFTKISREALHRFLLTDFVLTREEAIFGCMKVYMLEHGQPQNDSAEEVFRDRIVAQFMNDLLRPYTYTWVDTHSSKPVLPMKSEDLEVAATSFLGKTPFYQYYTDFVALYDAISFSDPLFARLLLPPTSMRYAPDYRKHLWNDFRHVLKTIRTPVDQVICEDIKEYFWPVETDAQMIGLYLRSLLKDSLQGFVYLVALHHVASSIWPDLNEADWSEDRGSKLFSAVIEQGTLALIREVVRYRQDRFGLSAFPPHCFELVDMKIKSSRLDCVGRWGGQALIDRLQGLFNES